MKRAGLSEATRVTHEQNKLLEQRLAKVLDAAEGRTKLEAGKRKSEVTSESACIQRRHQELQLQIAKLEHLNIKASGAGPRLPSIPSDKSVPVVRGEQLRRMDRNFDDRIRHQELRLMLQRAQELDLAFLVDATASMSRSIDEVKNLAPKIAAEVQKAFPKLKLRVAFVPYRDYAEHDEDDAEKCDFTDSFKGPGSVFVKAVAKVEAKGGADPAEDVFSGLERAASLSWSSKTRVLIHIGDAPCHGKEFHDLEGGDSYSEGDRKGRDISKLLEALRYDCQIVNYLFCHITDHTKKMLRVFRERAPQGGWILEEKLDDIDQLLVAVVSTSCGSISVSSRIMSAGASVPKYLPVAWKNEIPNWKSLEWQKGVQFSYKLPATLDELLKIVADNGSFVRKQKPASKVKMAARPFTDEGNFRWPFHAQVRKGLWNPPGRMVVKRFKELVGEHSSKVHTMEAYCEQMEVQTLAAFMAKQFNLELQKLPAHIDYKTVLFTAVSVLRVGDSKYYNMEMWLEGQWIRYSNNVKYVNTKEYADTLHAFSHWTYQRSEGLLMVTDLQGVLVKGGSNGKSVFILCDPAVHCKHPYRYELTSTNWSTEGMDCFFETHRCNDICRGLELKPK